MNGFRAKGLLHRTSRIMCHLPDGVVLKGFLENDAELKAFFQSHAAK
jgi:hypothetical protein